MKITDYMIDRDIAEVERISAVRAYQKEQKMANMTVFDMCDLLSNDLELAKELHAARYESPKKLGEIINDHINRWVDINADK